MPEAPSNSNTIRASSTSRGWKPLACGVVALMLSAVVYADDTSNPQAIDTTQTQATDEKTLGENFNGGIDFLNGKIATVMFFDVSFGAFKKPKKNDAGKDITDKNGEPVMEGPEVGFTIIFLAAGAVFFTFWYGFINIRGFSHALAVVRGKYSKTEDPGEVTPFRALTSALSATVGLGNIAGVAIAVKTGGPGAIFWMMVLGFFGMTAKFHESTLAQMFRRKNEDGTISGGPMYYLDQGLRERGMASFGKILAVIFAIFCMAGALGGGNMFQANQAYEGFHAAFVQGPTLAEETKENMPADALRALLTDAQLKDARSNPEETLGEVRNRLDEITLRSTITVQQVEDTLDPKAVKADEQRQADQKYRVSIGFGIVMAVVVGIVVVGGITRIGAATSKIVPTMCLLYVIGCLVVILSNLDQLPGKFVLILDQAFNWEAGFGGIVGVIIMGFKRAAFSSEAGLGSSAIAHSAAKASHPAREGFVASLEPFVDTIIICFMTAMVVLITGAYDAPQLKDEAGTAVTLYAFEQTPLGGWFPSVLSISIVLFAFSTMISWCYYGERAFGYLFHMKFVVIFRVIFVACVFVGSVTHLGPILDFSDLMILSMAFPNILGGLFLVGVVKRSLREYLGQQKTEGT